jgi:hypothetical protein
MRDLYRVRIANPHQQGFNRMAVMGNSAQIHYQLSFFCLFTFIYIYTKRY